MTQEAEAPLPDINPLRKQVQAKIKKLELLSSTGLWILALFTALSMGAFRNFDFLPPLSEGIRAALGAGPPVKYINGALLIYGFSAIILILTQMASDKRPRGALGHFGYLGAFYLFYPDIANPFLYAISPCFVKRFVFIYIPVDFIITQIIKINLGVCTKTFFFL